MQSQRFDAEQKPSHLRQAYENQIERIKYDELMSDRQNVVRLEKNINLRAGWNENLEEASWKKRIMSESNIIKGELRMAASASLAVRRVALKQLLQRDYETYEKELSLLGKTFFKQRI